MRKFVCAMIALAATAMFASGPAYAAQPAGCDLIVQELGEAKINGYDALLGGDYLEPIRLRLRNRGNVVCNGILKIDRTGSFDRLSGPQSNYMDYVIVDPTNIGHVILDPISQQSQGIPVTINANSSIDVNPRLMVRGGQPGRQGRYYATLRARVDLGSGENRAESQFNVSAQVQSRVQANFVGGRNATLDLGELSPSVTRSIQMQVRSSADIDVTVTSENEGALLQNGGSGNIPYSMTVDGRSIDLDNGSSFNVQIQNSIRGQSLPVVVTVGQFSNAPVGAYGDVVTFRISAR